MAKDIFYVFRDRFDMLFFEKSVEKGFENDMKILFISFFRNLGPLCKLNASYMTVYLYKA